MDRKIKALKELGVDSEQIEELSEAGVIKKCMIYIYPSSSKKGGINFRLRIVGYTGIGREVSLKQALSEIEITEVSQARAYVSLLEKELRNAKRLIKEVESNPPNDDKPTLIGHFKKNVKINLKSGRRVE